MEETNDSNNMRKVIQQFFKDNNMELYLCNCELKNELVVKSIYNLIVDGIATDSHDNEEYYLYGIFFYIKKLYDSAIGFFRKVLINDPKDIKSMEALLKSYLLRSDKNEETIIALCSDYYSLANNLESKFHQGQSHYLTGWFFQKIKKCDVFITYYKLAINYSNIRAMVSLGDYFYSKSNENESIKYYKMAVECASVDAYTRLFSFKKEILINNNIPDIYQYGFKFIATDSEKFISVIVKNSLKEIRFDIFNQMVIKYPAILRDKNYSNDIVKAIIGTDKITSDVLEIIQKMDFSLATIQIPPWIIPFKKLLNEKIDLLDMHLRYSANGIGFEDAKKDFLARLSINSATESAHLAALDR